MVVYHQTDADFNIFDVITQRMSSRTSSLILLRCLRGRLRIKKPMLLLLQKAGLLLTIRGMRGIMKIPIILIKIIRKEK